MTKTIVWATDGSENADRAVSVARTLARETAASLVVVHIVQRSLRFGPGSKVVGAASLLTRERVALPVLLAATVAVAPRWRSSPRRRRTRSA
jgi:nucleotide-binding universal stress UspA family protein